MTMSRQCFYSSSGGATMKNNTLLEHVRKMVERGWGY